MRRRNSSSSRAPSGSTSTGTPSRCATPSAATSAARRASTSRSRARWAAPPSRGEPGAPELVWVSLLASGALLGVLTAGKPRTFAKVWFAISAVVLVLVALPFFLDQVRGGLYPQLRGGSTWDELSVSTMPAFYAKR